jgi:hypothetical protein
VQEFYPEPMLESAAWADRFEVSKLLHTDYWSEASVR